MKKYEAPTLWTMKAFEEDVLSVSIQTTGKWEDGDGTVIDISGLF